MDEQIIKRIMPNRADAEKALVASMLMDRDAITVAIEKLSPEDFYHAEYGAVFRAVMELFNQGKPVDMVSVQERMSRMDLPPEVVSVEFMRDLFENAPVSGHADYYADLVHEKAVMRRLIHASDEITESCYSGKEDLKDILELAEKKIFDVLMQRRDGEDRTIDQITLSVIDSMEKAARSHSPVTGLATGFTGIDRLTSGLQNSDLILIAARPSMGKTAFVLNVAHYMSVLHDKHVAFFSLEMSGEQLVNRMISMESGVKSDALRNGRMTEREWADMAEAAGRIAQSNLHIIDSPGIDPGTLRAKCRKLKLEKKLDIIMIDYLQLMSGDRNSHRSSESRQNEVSEISRALKGLARELNVPVVALSQLSRAVESRTDKRPQLSDLRESGAIEQDADIVMFLYREEYYKADTDKKNIGEVIIRKQRNGGLGTVELTWIPDRTKFANLEKLQEQ